ncbi:hypothetical protein T459_03315 [Capsicum annuum]|uniref:Uncharacterized protein n=1 Tax=Capsicum annuum TaxID=4072 RepID=A0A2G3AMP9_CAPAN|nr:hypothetical protein T459_03315 [Capsicum annuum]
MKNLAARQQSSSGFKKGIWMLLDRNLEVYFSSREKQFLYDIVANGRNGIDVDKFDYIVRDARACALGCNFQFQRFSYLHTLGFLSSNSHVVSVIFEVPSTFDIGYELAHVECGRLTHAPADVGCGLRALFASLPLSATGTCTCPCCCAL